MASWSMMSEFVFMLSPAWGIVFSPITFTNGSSISDYQRVITNQSGGPFYNGKVLSMHLKVKTESHEIA